MTEKEVQQAGHWEELDTYEPSALMPLPEMPFQSQATTQYRPIPATEGIDLRRMAATTEMTAAARPYNRSRAMARLIVTGFVQVALVSINTYQIAHGLLLGSFFVGFLISLVWTLNVKSIVVGGWTERVVYSLSAAVGTVVGMILPQLWY